MNASNQYVSLWKWDSLPFGETTPNVNLSSLGVMAFNHKFPGQYTDSETGLSPNWFRDYDTLLGRYTKSDPIGLGGGINTFAYGHSDPISNMDRLGLDVTIAIRRLTYSSNTIIGFITPNAP